MTLHAVLEIIYICIQLIFLSIVIYGFIRPNENFASAILKLVAPGNRECYKNGFQYEKINNFPQFNQIF